MLDEEEDGSRLPIPAQPEIKSAKRSAKREPRDMTTLAIVPVVQREKDL